MSAQRTSSSSKRASTITPSAPTLPKPPTTIDPTAIVAEKAILGGTYPVTISANAVIHPFAKLLSTNGSVSIGEGCLIWEKSCVGLGASAEDGKDAAASQGSTQDGVVLERNVIIECGARVEATRVGEGTVVEVNARVGPGAVIGKHCKITPLSVIAANEVLPDYTVVFGSNQRRVNQTLKTNEHVEQLQDKGHLRHIDMLRKLIPNSLAKWQ